MKIALTVNGAPVTRDVEGRQNLVDFLRYDLGLTGSHVGCEHGVCGACTVRVDGTPVRGCLMLAAQADGCRVETIEGPRRERRDRRPAARLPRGERAPVRVLHAGHAADGARAARARVPSRSGGHPRGPRRQLLPLHGLSRHRPGRPSCGPAPSRCPDRTGQANLCEGHARASRCRVAVVCARAGRCRGRQLHRPLGRAAPDGAARRRPRHLHRRRGDPAPSARGLRPIAPCPRAHRCHRHRGGVVAAGRGRRGHRPRAGGALRAVGGRAEELPRDEVRAPVSPGPGQGGVAGRAGGRGGGGVSRPRGGRLRARARDVGAAAPRRGRRGGAGARSDAHPSGARRQPRARDAREIGRRGRGVSIGRRGLPGHLRHRAPHRREPRGAGRAGRLRPGRRDADRLSLRPGAVHAARHPVAPSRDPRAPRARDQQGRRGLVRAQDPHVSRRDRDLRAGGDARPAREVPRRSHRVVPDGHPLARPSRHRGGGGQARRDDPRDAPRRPGPRRPLLDVSALERRRVRPDLADHARPLPLARLRGARPRGAPEQDADVPVPRRRPPRRRARDGGHGRSRRARAVARSRRRAAPEPPDRRHVPVHRAHRALLREALARGVARRGAGAVGLSRDSAPSATGSARAASTAGSVSASSST